MDDFNGILLVNKPKGKTSFSLVGVLRKITGVKTIGHAGTLDPFATGVMVLLIGRKWTRCSDRLITADKHYLAELKLGMATDTYDCEGVAISESAHIPTLIDIQQALQEFQGECLQTPPMFSAKKVNGKKLYEYARKGKEIERAAVKVNLQTDFIHYEYPVLTLSVQCSKGTYIRSIAHDLGRLLGCGAHLTNLQRIKSGSFLLEKCIDGALLFNPSFDKSLLNQYLIREIEMDHEDCSRIERYCA